MKRCPCRRKKEKERKEKEEKERKRKEEKVPELIFEEHVQIKEDGDERERGGESKEKEIPKKRRVYIEKKKEEKEIEKQLWRQMCALETTSASKIFVSGLILSWCW